MQSVTISVAEVVSSGGVVATEERSQRGSGGQEVCGDRGRDRGDVDRPLERGELLREPLRPADLDTSDGERAAEERPVRVDEAERAVHIDRADDVPDERYLTEHALDELRAVTADDELLASRAEQPPSTCRRGRLSR